ncbi:hypothetical protein RHMOL_Rhmol08G0144200 [Rhododendron molle]|uniref:Uncharacterized protein n=1 Tax=Rhododendron molle TaxID=49168 RepID=A0ACC0MQD1_RHOML|nr:hypothetical protein RHMOL_Rhmol08G0144200 [Rhododendron molle]
MIGFIEEEDDYLGFPWDDPYKNEDSDSDEIEGEFNDPLDGVSLVYLFNDLEVTNVHCINAIDDGEWWTEIYEALPEVWELSIGNIESADLWSFEDREVDHLSRSGRLYNPLTLGKKTQSQLDQWKRRKHLKRSPIGSSNN